MSLWWPGRLSEAQDARVGWVLPLTSRPSPWGPRCPSAPSTPATNPSTNKGWFSSRPQEGQRRRLEKVSLLRGEWAGKPGPGLREAQGKKPQPGRASPQGAVRRGGRRVSWWERSKDTPASWALRLPGPL